MRSIRSNKSKTTVNKPKATQRSKATAKKKPHQEDSLKMVLVVCLMPVLLMMIDGVGLSVPSALIAGVTSCCAFIAIARSFNNPDYLILAGLLYFPFAGMYSVNVGPGLNGTNIILMMALILAFYYTAIEKRVGLPDVKGQLLMVVWVILTVFAALTSLINFGSNYLLVVEFNNYKALIDQFIWYYTVLSIIQVAQRAEKAWLFIIIASVVSVLFGFNESLGRVDVAMFDDSRVGGPQSQANEYGAYVAYTMMPMLAWLVAYFPYKKAYMVIPGLLLALKVLVSTYSRASYLGFVIAAAAISLNKGKRFTLGVLIVAIGLGVAFPQLLPESVVSRLNQTFSQSTQSDQKLDRSSADRLILWEAAIDMSLEDPLLGKGFKGFPYLKQAYTSEPVPVSDPHNMYLMIASEMGMPAVIVFFSLLFFMFYSGLLISRSSQAYFKPIGYSLCGVAVCIALVNMFGSRMVNLNFTASFWIFLAIAQTMRLRVETEESKAKGDGGTGTETTTHAQSKKTAYEKKPTTESRELQQAAQQGASPARRQKARRLFSNKKL